VEKRAGIFVPRGKCVRALVIPVLETLGAPLTFKLTFSKILHAAGLLQLLVFLAA